MRTLILLAVSATVVSACASTGDRIGDSTVEMAAKCRERGGVLVPSGRPSTGRPEADNVCQISGGASRLP